MKNNNFILPDEIYYEYLEKIEGIKFTRREIDVIAYLLSGRSAKTISSLLPISPKTVETHIRNVMMKLEATSKEGIITFIEKSDKFSIFKKYYSSLLTQTFFENRLKDISALISEAPHCHLIFWKEHEDKSSYIHQLESHLKLAGIKTFIDPREGHRFLIDPINDSTPHGSDYVLYSIPEDLLSGIYREDGKDPLDFPHFIQRVAENPSHIILLLPRREAGVDIQEKLGRINYLDVSEQENYYFLFFSLLNKIIPNINIGKVILEFKEHFNSTYTFPVIEKIPVVTEGMGFKKYKSLSILLFLFFICILGLGYFSLLWKQEHDPAEERGGKYFIRSDLIIPTETTLLPRSELLSQIDERFKTQQPIQTVALTGIGGSGKTTIARHYAHGQKANLIWEINAETKESLRKSFESLAQALAKTEEDQKALRDMQELSLDSEREEKFIQFVREHLRLHAKWFLVYDNVEKFGDIQKFFPQDDKTWGMGKVILTTRDGHIQTNSHVNHVIYIGELHPQESLDLYLRIMKNRGNQILTAASEEVKKFLEKIPPFPLDVSIAAYYIKATNISYDQYLERLNEENKDFSAVQESLLKEATDYTHSRYNLITLSLKNIIITHKNFSDLILLISLLDSQNIPREILDNFKNKEVIDNFIYNLKKYSLISNNLSPSPLGPTFSVHRSTQAISLAYLKRHLNLEKNKHLIENIAHPLANYAKHVMESEDFLQTKFLANQLEVFLKHEHLLNDLTRGSIKGELGCMYCRIKNFTQAKELLEDAFSILGKNYHNDSRVAQILLYLGNVYQELGNYEKARDTLNQALILYQKSAAKDHYVGEARVLSYLGSIYRYFGNHEKAAELLEQSYNIYKIHVSEDHVGAIFALSHLGVLQGALGHNEKAKHFLEKSFLAYKKQFSEHSVRAAWVLAHLGSVYKNLGEYDKAKRLLEKTLKIYKAHFSEHNLVIGWVLTHLGSVHLELGNYEEAKILLEKSLNIHKKNLKEGHLKIAWTSLNLGRAYVGLSRFQEGQALLEKSLKSCEAQNEKNHIEIARILRALGEAHLVKDQLETAEKYFLKSLNIFLQNKHPDQYMIFEGLAKLALKKSIQAMHTQESLQSQNFKPQAIGYLKQALDVVKAHFPVDSPHRVRIELTLQKL